MIITRTLATHSLMSGVLPMMLALGTSADAAAQVPDKCFEIESILVDACTAGGQCGGASEGANEMVRFITGPYPIALSDISIQWPNNSYQGLIQNPASAALTAELNASIEACGHLLEPTGGIIPAGSRVLLITSTDMCVEANSFAALSDTLYVVYQYPGNTAGHFANHNNGSDVSGTPSGGASLRTLVMTYLPNACGDTATYDRQQLLNIYGTYGGSSAENDGATALFDWPGAPLASYINLGCQAPFIPLTVDITTPGGELACGGTVALQGTVSGGSSTLAWSGGNGTFSTPDGENTTYAAGSGDTGTITLYLCVSGSCAQDLCDSVAFTLLGGPTAEITADGPLQLCPGDQAILTASGGDTYSWSSGETIASIAVDQAGVYHVLVGNDCGTDEASVSVTTSQVPEVLITGDTVICGGGITVLTGSGGLSYNWSTGSTTASITVDAPGVYAVSASNACGTGEASVTVTLAQIGLSATASPMSGSAPLAVDFMAVSDPLPIGWEWDLGNGATAEAAATSTIYTAPGAYAVTLVATDADGCTYTVNFTVLVSDLQPSTVGVPNVFSPNGDGQNDAFQVLSTGLANLDVLIFDRWGKQVARIDRPTGVWSGRTDGGALVSDGTYFYRLVATGYDGRAYDLHGTITVLR